MQKSRSKYREYIQLDKSQLVFIEKPKRAAYWCSLDGIIYAEYAQGFHAIEKRIGSRGYLEFKINGRNLSYKRIVAIALIPNTENCDKVFSKNGDQFDTRPNNLKWVWTRENKRYSNIEALLKTKDRWLIEYYQTGSKIALDKGFTKAIAKLNINIELLSDLYLIFVNYAERCLLFDICKDIKTIIYGINQINKRAKHHKSIDSLESKDKVSYLK